MKAALTPDLHTKLLGETARVDWPEIERHFAGGHVIFVNAELDLISVGEVFAQDASDQLRAWMQAGQVGLLTDELAVQWSQFQGQAEGPSLWALVVRPWVLVQARA